MTPVIFVEVAGRANDWHTLIDPFGIYREDTHLITVMAIGSTLRFLAILFSRMIRFHNACLVGKHVRKRDGVIDVRRGIRILKVQHLRPKLCGVGCDA